MTGNPISWLVALLVGWLSSSQLDDSTDCSVDWLIDRSISWLVVPNWSVRSFVQSLTSSVPLSSQREITLICYQTECNAVMLVCDYWVAGVVQDAANISNADWWWAVDAATMYSEYFLCNTTRAPLYGWPFSIISALSTVGWCRENFMMISNGSGVIVLTDRQTDEHTNRRYWKQY